MTHHHFTRQRKVSFDARALSPIILLISFTVCYFTDVEAELKDLVVVLRAVDWYQLGIQLNVPTYILRSIIEANPNNISMRLSQMLDYWKENDEDPSWERIAEAVQRIGGHRNVIAEIRSKYMSHEPSSSAALLEGAHQLPSLQHSEDASLQRATVGNKANNRYVFFYQ